MRSSLKLPLARSILAAGAGSGSARGFALNVVGACAGVLAAAAPLACSSSPHETGFETDDGGAEGSEATSSSGSSSGFTSSGNASSSGFSSGGSSGDATTTSSNDCPAGASKYIYVVTDQNELYTFDPTLAPAAMAFADLGPIHCPGEPTPPPANGGVNSMAVDRQAVAWINFNDGKIFKVDTTQKSLPCSVTNFSSGSSGFTPQLGMGFATVSTADHSETLYVSDNGGSRRLVHVRYARPRLHGLRTRRGHVHADADADWSLHQRGRLQRGAERNGRR